MIIGVNGVAQSGKDTIGTYLIENYGYERRAFADKIKEAALLLDPIVQTAEVASEIDLRLSMWVDLFGWEQAKAHPEVRRTLQRFGSEVGRTIFGETVWIDLLFKNGTPDNLVITDCRFPNEAEAIKKHGGMVWVVQRPGYTPALGHISDTALTDWEFDATLLNDGTVQGLYAQVDRLLWPNELRFGNFIH